jgi:hypothetical protein
MKGSREAHFSAVLYLIWSGQPGQEKCRLHMEYLKISGFQNSTIIAVTFNP